VRWSAGSLVATVDARVTNDEGEPVPGVEVTLSADSSAPVITPDTLTTSGSGRAQFVVSTFRGESVTFAAVASDGDTEATAEVRVAFRLSLDLSASAPQLTYPGARAQLLATVADDEGPVAGIEIEVVAGRESDAIEPARATTDASGNAALALEATEIGEATARMTVVGLDLGTAPTATVSITTPSISATWSHSQPDAVLIAPRAGLVWIDTDPVPGAPLAARELASVGIDPVPDIGDSGTVTLQLPLDPPEQDLYHPDRGNPDLPDSLRAAPYGLGIYDDLDLSGDLTPADAMVALSDADAVLVYARGELPGADVVPGLVAGYQYFDSLRGDPPTAFGLDALTRSPHMDIRMAPCTSGSLDGRVAVTAAAPGDVLLHVALVLVDAESYLAGDVLHLLDADNFLEIATTSVSCPPGETVRYALQLDHPSAVASDYQDFLAPIPGGPALGLMLPLLYIDSDGDGAFTNDDNNLSTGDRVAGGLNVPFGEGRVYIGWVDAPIPPMLSFGYPGLNQGYNVVREPLRVRIAAVNDDSTLRLSFAIEGGHKDLGFRIQHPDGAGAEVVMTGSDLTTGPPGSNDVVRSAAGGFAGVVDPSRDVLVFTNRVDGITYDDLDTTLDLESL
jgi:hypothetical protein